MISEQAKVKFMRLAGLLLEGRVDVLRDQFVKWYVDKHAGKIGDALRIIVTRDAKETFAVMVNTDPTSNKKFLPWLIALYKKDNLKAEDHYKATEYLALFERVKEKLSVGLRDILRYGSLPELYDKIKGFEAETAISNSELERQKKLEGADRIFESDRWLVISPRNKAAACLYGKDTKWCTSSTDSENMYHAYTENGEKLYILIDKQAEGTTRENPMKKLQFSFAETMFMDASDRPIDIAEFMRNNRELYDVFLGLGEFDSAAEVRFRMLSDEKAKQLFSEPMNVAWAINENGADHTLDYMLDLGMHEKLFAYLKEDTDGDFSSITTHLRAIVIRCRDDHYDKLFEALTSPEFVTQVMHQDAKETEMNEIVRKYIKFMGQQFRDSWKDFTARVLQSGLLERVFMGMADEYNYMSESCWNFIEVVASQKTFGYPGVEYCLRRLKEDDFKELILQQSGPDVYNHALDMLSNMKAVHRNLSELRRQIGNHLKG